MSSDVPGLWRAIWRHRRMVIRGWDLWCSLAIGVVSGTVLTDSQVARLSKLAPAQLGVAAALLGVVLAGLAILVVFLSKEYLEVLTRAQGGIEADLFPFWFTAALTVAAIFLSAVTVVLYPNAGRIVGRLLVGASVWLFFWGVFAALNVVAFVAAHGTTRARQILGRTK